MVGPKLKAMVTAASQALARLDAARLEELALSCAALNRAMAPLRASDPQTLVGEARAAAGEMAVLARVLEATRGNIRVINRLRELRLGRLEYGDRPANGWCAANIGDGSGDGDD